MDWIRVTNENEASGKLQEIYRETINRRGKLSNIMRIHSLNPVSMKAHMDLYLAVMFQHSGLKRPERELLAVVVSLLNRCEYCIHHHAEALNFYWKDESKIRRLIDDYTSFPFNERERALVRFAEMLTLHPAEASDADVNQLRQAGFSDSDILDATLVVSYFNFVNRLANGLGVEFSPEEMRGYRY